MVLFTKPRWGSAGFSSLRPLQYFRIGTDHIILLFPGESTSARQKLARLLPVRDDRWTFFIQAICLYEARLLIALLPVFDSLGVPAIHFLCYAAYAAKEPV